MPRSCAPWDSGSALPNAMSEVREELARFFPAVLNIEAPTDEVDLIERGVLDSLAIVELVLYLEQRCGVKLNMDALDFDDLRTVPAICRLVERSRSARGS